MPEGEQISGMLEAGGPVFGRSVYPISTVGRGGSHYAHSISTCLPGFLDLATSLNLGVPVVMTGGRLIDLSKIGGASGTPGTPGSGISELKL